MQAERGFQSIDKKTFISMFDDATAFSESEMQRLLNEPDVKEVHVFKATPENEDMARMRQAFPGLNRQQLRKKMRQLPKKNK